MKKGVKYYTWLVFISWIYANKRDSALEEHKEVLGLHDWLKYQPFIVIGSDLWSKKSVNYLSCIDRNGGFKGILFSAQNAELFVDL